MADIILKESQIIQCRNWSLLLRLGYGSRTASCISFITHTTKEQTDQPAPPPVHSLLASLPSTVSASLICLPPSPWLKFLCKISGHQVQGFICKSVWHLVLSVFSPPIIPVILVPKGFLLCFCLLRALEPELEFESVASVQFSRLVVSDSLQPHGLQHASLPCPSPTPRACLNSCPSSRWCHPTISSSVVPFSSCLLSFPASGSFSMSQFFTSGGQSIGVSASASVLPMNIKDWFPLGRTGLISLQSKGLSRVLSNTTVQKHQLFSAQLSL